MSLQSNQAISTANGSLDVPNKNMKTSKVSPAVPSENMELTEVKVAKDPNVSAITILLLIFFDSSK